MLFSVRTTFTPNYWLSPLHSVHAAPVLLGFVLETQDRHAGGVAAILAKGFAGLD